MAEKSSSSWVLWLVLGLGCAGVLAVVGVFVIFGAAGYLFTRGAERQMEAAESAVREVEAQEAAAEAERINRQEEAAGLAAEAQTARDNAEAERAARQAEEEQRNTREAVPSDDPLSGLEGL